MDYSLQRSFTGLSSIMSVEITGKKEKQVQRAVFDTIRYVAMFESKWSAFSKKSTIFKLNTKANKWIRVEPYTADILRKAYLYTKKTNSVYSIFSGVYSFLWKEAIKKEELPSEESLYFARSKFMRASMEIKRNYIKNTQKSALDLGGCAKGYIADYIKAKLLKRKGVDTICLDFGGNILVASKAGQRFNIGIQDPINRGRIALIIQNVSNKSVVTSGDYIRYFIHDGKKYHHIIDMETGYPVASDVCSVTICDEDGFLSEILSTYCFIKGLSSIDFCEKENIAAIYILKNGKVLMTSKVKNASVIVKD